MLDSTSCYTNITVEDVLTNIYHNEAFSNFHENPSSTTTLQNCSWQESEIPKEINLLAKLDP